MHFLYSKADEATEEDRLGYILPGYEFFHQDMVTADCRKELFMDPSRGLPGGSFHKATLINRTDAKEKKGKEAISSISDFIKINCQVRFNQYFIQKYHLDVNKDNTPDYIRKSSKEEQIEYLHSMTSSVLKD